MTNDKCQMSEVALRMTEGTLHLSSVICNLSF
jgi:hypothetical protein